MKKKTIVIAVVVLVCIIAAVIIGSSGSNDSKKLPGTWAASEYRSGYPETLIINKNGTGFFDGKACTYVATGMSIKIYVDYVLGTQTYEYFYSVHGRNSINLVSIDEPTWSSEYGIEYYKR